MEDSEIHLHTHSSTNTFVSSIFNLRFCRRNSLESASNILEAIGDFCTMKELKQRFLMSGGVGEGVVSSKDIDFMLIDTSIIVNQEDRPKSLETDFELRAVTDHTKAGFAKLLVAEPESFPLKDCTRIIDGKYYLSSSMYIQKQLQIISEVSDAEGTHGPAVLRARASEVHTPSDIVGTLRSPQWPEKVFKAFKSRVLTCNRWFTEEMVAHIENCGCLYVPIGHPLSSDKDLEWRLSFSITENYLVRSLNHVQYNCYNFLKLLGEKMHQFKHEKLLCSYFFKTALFWTIEEEEKEIWVECNILSCISSVLERMSYFYQRHDFPNYFLPDNNMVVHLPVERCSQLAEEFSDIRKDLVYNIFSSLELGVRIEGECVAFFERLNLEDIKESLSSFKKEIREAFYRNLVTALEALDASHLHDLMETGSADISSSSEFFKRKYRRDIRNDLMNFLDPNLFDFLEILSRKCTFETKRDALLSVRDDITQIVTNSKLNLCYGQALSRALGNICHNEVLGSVDQKQRKKLLEEAEDYYKKGLEMVFPDGFDDQMFSGKVHLAQFYYMNNELKEAAQVLNEVDTVLNDEELVSKIGDACICTELCVPVHLEALQHDKGLFEYFSTLSFRESKFINSVALAYYLKLKCYQELLFKAEGTVSVDKEKYSDKSKGMTHEDLLKQFEKFCAFYLKTPSFALIDRMLKETSKVLLQIAKDSFTK